MVKALYDYGLSLENLYGRNTIGNTAADAFYYIRTYTLVSPWHLSNIISPV